MEDFKKINGKEVRAIEVNDGDSNDTKFLGRLFWYTIGETLAPIDEYSEFVKINNITRELVPNAPKPKNAWRRATKDMEHAEELDDDTTVEFMTRRLNKDVRHFVREVKNTKKGRLEYEELIKWTYVKAEKGRSEYVSWNPLVDDESRIKDIAKYHRKMGDIKERYEKSFTEHEIRRAIRDILEQSRQISLKSSGGVYFIPEQYAEKLTDIKSVLTHINKWGQSSFRSELWQVPVISNNEQRDMIEQGIREETVSYADSKMKEIKELLENGEEITQKRYTTLITELKKVEERKNEYAEIIGRNLETCDEQLDIMKLQIRKLADNVKETGKTKSLNDFTE